MQINVPAEDFVSQAVLGSILGVAVVGAFRFGLWCKRLPGRIVLWCRTFKARVECRHLRRDIRQLREIYFGCEEV
jgi:hypothetical protein